MAVYFSQATNFDSGSSSNIDPRTGMFSASLSLGTLIGNDGRGPFLPLEMVYAPFTDSNYGLGQGWKFNYTTYDDENATLFVASGENFKVNQVGSYSIQQQKVNTTIFSKFPIAGQTFSVRHSTGSVEVLDGGGVGGYVPTSSFSALGAKLNLGWVANKGIPFLSSITDENNTLLLSATSEIGGNFEISIWPHSTTNAYLVKGTVVGELLQSLKIADWEWQFFYDTTVDKRGALLTKVIYPSGLVEEVKYVANVQHFPEVAKLSALPAVSIYTQTPNGNQPDIIAKYTFSSNNFLGNNGNFTSYTPGEENLYECPLNNYEYTSTEEITSAKSQSKTIRTYNMFHLMNKQVYSCGSVVLTKDITYGNLSIGVKFDDQPNNFQLPTVVSNVYTRPDGEGGQASRTETILYSYYPNGQHKSMKADDGTLTEWEYYPVSGDGNKCPADQSGIGQYLKFEKTTSPAIGSYQSSILLKSYQYEKLDVGGDPQNPYSPIQYAVAPSFESHSVDGATIYSLATHYVKTKNRDFGQVSSQVETIINGDDTYPSTLAYTYTTDSTAGTWTVTKDISPWDAGTDPDIKTYSVSTIYDVLTGAVKSTIDRNGVLSSYTYDVHVQETVRTKAVGTIYETSSTTAYAFETNPLGGGGLLPTRTVRNELGVAVKTWFNGFLTPILQQKIAKNAGGKDIACDAQTYQYDDEGRLIVGNEYDYDADGMEVLVDNSVSYTYDEWGGIMRNANSDGSFVNTISDPIYLTVTQTWSGGGNAKIITTYNKMQLATKIERYNQYSELYSTIENTYDGLKRLRKCVDELGNATHYQYDVWGRRSDVALADDTAYTHDYAAHSNQALITSVALVGVSLPLGEQAFDGLGRVTMSTWSGRTKTFDYRSGSQLLPNTITTPDKTKIENNYIPELGSSLKSTTTSDGQITNKYTYNVPFGWLETAKNASDDTGPTVSYAYDKWARIIEKTYTYPAESTSENNKVRTVTYAYSRFGRTLRVEEFDQYTATSYNTNGQIIEIDGGTATAKISYDNGQISGWSVTSKDGRKLTVVLTYDEFLRETERSVTDSRSKTTLTFSQEYRLNNTLSKRTLKSGSSSIRVETFEYDKRGRLTSFMCTGTSCPQAVGGQNIRQQVFVYDDINNITSVVTTFDGGQNTSTYKYENKDDPFQLTSLENSDPGYVDKVVFAYNASGQMTKDEEGRTLSYDSLGRLSSINRDGAATSYFYDALSVLRKQTLPDNRWIEFYYDGLTTSCIIEGQDKAETVTQWLRVGNNCFAEMIDTTPPTLIFTDSQGSVITRSSLTGPLDIKSYTPYGDQVQAEGDSGSIAYNGALKDPLTGQYHLGRGYRTYNPRLMRMTSPDSLSPFGKGGINPYAYCAGDPINTSDPTGQSQSLRITVLVGSALLTWIVPGIGLMVDFAEAAATASAVVDTADTAESAESAEEASKAAKKTKPSSANKVNYTKMALGCTGTAFQISGVVENSQSIDFSAHLNIDDEKYSNGKKKLGSDLTYAGWAFSALSAVLTPSVTIAQRLSRTGRFAVRPLVAAGEDEALVNQGKTVSKKPTQNRPFAGDGPSSSAEQQVVHEEEFVNAHQDDNRERGIENHQGDNARSRTNTSFSFSIIQRENL